MVRNVMVEMINKIYTIDNLKEELESHDWLFLGQNWIGSLLEAYVFYEWGKQIKIHETDTGNCEENFFLVGQEEEMEKLADDICSNQPASKIVMLSNELKDILDSEMMRKYPNVYEREVLFRRKKEMDSVKSTEFRIKISNLLSMKKFPIFESIEIETINRCNGTCFFCPINRNDDTRNLHKMSDKLFYHIIDQLSDMDYHGRISLFSNNEPFIDERICDFAEYTAHKLPNACKIIFSNGTLVKESVFDKIIPYIDVFNFDIYYDMSIKDEIPNEVRNIIIHNQNNEAIKKKVMFQIINRSAIRNNRGGQSKNRNKLYRVEAPCMLPFIQMIVRPNGETSLCCNDALGKYTLADLNQETIVEAWNNKNYKLIREKLQGTRKNIDMCQLCDNFASSNTMGNDFFTEKQKMESWERIESLINI